MADVSLFIDLLNMVFSLFFIFDQRVSEVLSGEVGACLIATLHQQHQPFVVFDSSGAGPGVRPLAVLISGWINSLKIVVDS